MFLLTTNLAIFITCTLSAILTGILGIGGGLLIIPIFLFILPWFNINFSIFEIVSISINCVFINSFVACLYRRKEQFIDKKDIIKYSIFLILGSLIGMGIKEWINDLFILELYLIVFIIFILIMKKDFIFSKMNYIKKHFNINKNIDINKNKDGSKNHLIVLLIQSLSFTIVGVICSIIGIGGAIFYLIIIKSFSNYNAKNLVPTITLLVMINSLVLNLENFFTSTIFLEFIPIVIISSIIGVKIGTYIYKKLSDTTIQYLFIVVAIISIIKVGLKIIELKT